LASRVPLLPFLALCLAAAGVPLPAAAIVLLDFEQRFFIEPEAYAKDHSLLIEDGAYHLFYTVGREGEGWGQPGNEIDFGHAISTDLVHWTLAPRVLAIDPEGWKNRNLWAPHVVRAPSGAYHLYYTGVDSSVAQQTGVARSEDLELWTDMSVDSAIYHPSETWAQWELGTWSNGRDAFVTRMKGFWVLLASALTRPEIAGTERGALSLATSPDGFTWTDSGWPFCLNANNRVLESPFLHLEGDRFFLFFTEAGVGGVRAMSSIELFAPWDPTTATVLDPDAFAAEVLTTPEAKLITRVKGVHQPAGGITRGILIDTLHVEGETLDFGVTNRFWEEWTLVQGGGAFNFQPTYGDRPMGRTGIPSHVEGNFWVNTAESYAHPVYIGCPTCPPQESRTGIVRSLPFVVTAAELELWVGGAADPDRVYAALRRTSDGALLLRETGAGGDPMTRRLWDLRAFAGVECQIELADLSPTGHLNVDAIRELPDATGIGAEPPAPAPAARLVIAAEPSVVRGSEVARLVFAIPRSAQVAIDVFDVQGRRAAALAAGPRSAGIHRLTWDGRLQGGGRAPAGVYLVRLATEDGTASAKLTRIP
jgi:beta-fructofuranosidase